MDDKLPNDEPWVEIAIVLDKYHHRHGEAARALYNMGYRRTPSAQAPGMEAMPLPDPEHIWMAIRDCRRIVAEPGYLPTNIEYSNFLNMAGVLLDLASRKPLLIDREALVKACHEGMVNYVLEGPAGMARRIEAALQAAERGKA